MKLLLFTCCESVSVDLLTNRLSLFHLFDTFSSSSFPVTLPPMTMVAWVEKEESDEEECELETKWMFQGRELAKLPFAANFQNKPRTRAIAQVGGLGLLEPGTIDIQLRYKTKRLGIFRFYVASVSQPRSDLKSPATDTSSSVARPKRRPRKSKAKT